MGFRDIPQPFVCGVLVDDATVDGVTRTMKLAEYEGADVFDLELQSLAVWPGEARASPPGGWMSGAQDHRPGADSRSPVGVRCLSRFRAAV